MTFTTKIKNGITKIEDEKLDSLFALHAYIKFNSDKNKEKISILVENASVARWIFKVLKYNYNVEIILTMRTIKRFKLRNLYILEIKEKIQDIDNDISNVFSNILDSSDDEKAAFLKGVFLSCGSISDPKTNQYHLEFLVKSEEHANLINEILLSLEFNSKILKREREHMVYIKQSENISDFIKVLGAVDALFYFEDIRIYKDHKNMVNRLNNCEQANVEKSLRSSKIILDNIIYLTDNDLLNLFDERTLEIIEYKKTYPETSLLELSEIISLETNKSISKSGINHHFRKLNNLVIKHKAN